MSAPAGLRAALTSALAIDRTGFSPLVAVRCAAGVVVPFAIGTAVGHPAEGSITAAGALPTGVAGLSGGSQSPVRTIVAASVGMTLSTFVGSLVAGHFGPTLATMAVWGFAAGLAVVLSRTATVVATQAVMGLVVFGRFPGSVATSAAHAGWVLAGGGFQALLAATVRSPQRFGRERRILATAYSDLAELARDPSRSTLTAASEAARSATLIGARAPSEDLDVVRGLADEADRIRLELQVLATVHRVPSVTEVRYAAAAWLELTSTAIAAGLEPPTENPLLDQQVQALRDQAAAVSAGPRGTSVRYAAARGSALLGQLRAVDRLARALAGVRTLALPYALGAPVVLMMPRRTADALRQVGLTLRQPRSPAFRHAVRLAVALPAAEALSRALPGQRGYWVALTVVVVLRPDYAATAQRGVARVVGTGAGVLTAGLLVVALHPSGTTLTILIAVATWAGYATFAVSYATYSFAVTAIVVLLLAPVSGNGLGTVGDRGLDTLVGGALAMIAYLVWPTWESDTLTATGERLVGALASYADVLLGAYVEPRAVDRSEVAAAALDARRARMAVQASVDRAKAEPARYGADTETAGGVLSATRRIVIELNALRATVDDAAEQVGVPEVQPIRQAIVLALNGLATGRTEEVAGLRDRQRDLEVDLDEDPSTLHARRRALVAAHLDPLVDSIDTLAHVLAAPAA